MCNLKPKEYGKEKQSGEQTFAKATGAEAVVRNYSKIEKVIFWLDLSRKPELCKADFSDFNKMINWYEKAAKQKHIKAMVELAEWYTPIRCGSSAKHVIKQSPFFTLKCNFNHALSL